eukprot:1329025-Prorocentrum_lima.AAC.1
MIPGGGRVTSGTLAFERRPKGSGVLWCGAPPCVNTEPLARNTRLRRVVRRAYAAYGTNSQ